MFINRIIYHFVKRILMSRYADLALYVNGSERLAELAREPIAAMQRNPWGELVTMTQWDNKTLVS